MSELQTSRKTEKTQPSRLGRALGLWILENRHAGAIRQAREIAQILHVFVPAADIHFEVPSKIIQPVILNLTLISGIRKRVILSGRSRQRAPESAFFDILGSKASKGSSVTIALQIALAIARDARPIAYPINTDPVGKPVHSAPPCSRQDLVDQCVAFLDHAVARNDLGSAIDAQSLKEALRELTLEVQLSKAQARANGGLNGRCALLGVNERRISSEDLDAAVDA